MGDVCESHEITKTLYIHKFYCDNCNTYLGETREHDDGYYPEKGKFEESFCIDNKWFTKECYLCETCKKLTNDAIIKALMDLGFKPDSLDD